MNRLTTTQYIISRDTAGLAYLISAFGALVSMSIAAMVILKIACMYEYRDIHDGDMKIHITYTH